MHLRSIAEHEGTSQPDPNAPRKAAVNSLSGSPSVSVHEGSPQDDEQDTLRKVLKVEPHLVQH